MSLLASEVDPDPELLDNERDPLPMLLLEDMAVPIVRLLLEDRSELELLLELLHNDKSELELPDGGLLED